MALLFKHQDLPTEGANAKADTKWSGLKEGLDSMQRVVFYDCLERNMVKHIRRIAVWQHDFDETENPPATGDDTWWERQEHDEIGIATALQAAVGASPIVKLYRKDGLLSAVETNLSEGGEP